MSRVTGSLLLVAVSKGTGSARSLSSRFEYLTFLDTTHCIRSSTCVYVCGGEGGRGKEGEGRRRMRRGEKRKRGKRGGKLDKREDGGMRRQEEGVILSLSDVSTHLELKAVNRVDSS